MIFDLDLLSSLSEIEILRSEKMVSRFSSKILPFIIVKFI